jgi:tetratricopeptide (TPR) repeat protein
VKRTHIRAFAAAIAIFLTFPLGTAHSASDETLMFARAKEDFVRGLSFFNAYNYLAAAEHFRTALSKYPDYYTAREYLARSYRLAGYADEALTEWETLAKQSDSPAIKPKIESLHFREAGLAAKDNPEFYESLKIESESMGRYKFPAPVDVTTDAERNIYITSLTGGKIIKLDSSGKGEDSKSLSFTSATKPYGLDYRSGVIAVSDFASGKIYLLDESLRTKKSFGGSGNGNGQFNGPEGLCFDQKGNIYVADSANNRVQKFSPDGAFILSFGKEGNYEGELSKPADVAVKDNRVYVCDSGNARIAIFDDSGNFIENIRIEGLKVPRGISVRENFIVISDEFAGICFYSPSSKKAIFRKEWEDGKGSFVRVTGSMYDRDGFLYALDHGAQTLYVLAPLAMRYTNLDIEIQSVDTAKYPIVAFYCAVRDRTGHPVYGLTPADFDVTEDGAHIRNHSVSYLRDREPSASIAIVADRSPEAKPYAENLSWATDFIFRKMHKNDGVRVISFNSDSWADSNFDWSRLRALKSLSANRYAPGKNIGKALYSAIADCAPRISRRAAVLFTDGSVNGASFRQYTQGQIINYAREHFVPVYVVSFKEPDPALVSLAEKTGGAAIRASDADALGKLYDRIRDAEEYRYVIAYKTFKTAEFADWWSDVTVKVDIKGVSGYEWAGYFVPFIKGTERRSALPVKSGGAAPAGGGHGGGAPAPAPAPAAGGGHGGGH